MSGSKQRPTADDTSIATQSPKNALPRGSSICDGCEQPLDDGEGWYCQQCQDCDFCDTCAADAATLQRVGCGGHKLLRAGVLSSDAPSSSLRPRRKSTRLDKGKKPAATQEGNSNNSKDAQGNNRPPGEPDQRKPDTIPDSLHHLELAQAFLARSNYTMPYKPRELRAADEQTPTGPQSHNIALLEEFKQTQYSAQQCELADAEVRSDEALAEIIRAEMRGTPAGSRTRAPIRERVKEQGLREPVPDVRAIFNPKLAREEMKKAMIAFNNEVGKGSKAALELVDIAKQLGVHFAVWDAELAVDPEGVDDAARSEES